MSWSPADTANRSYFVAGPCSARYQVGTEPALARASTSSPGQSLSQYSTRLRPRGHRDRKKCYPNHPRNPFRNEKGPHGTSSGRPLVCAKKCRCKLHVLLRMAAIVAALGNVCVRYAEVFAASYKLYRLTIFLPSADVGSFQTSSQIELHQPQRQEPILRTAFPHAVQACQISRTARGFHHILFSF